MATTPDAHQQLPFRKRDSSEESLQDVQERRADPVLLSGRQLEVHRALLETSQAAATKYLGAVHVIGGDNPDRWSLAAHAMRELLDKLPGVMGVDAGGDFSLKGRVGDLRSDWKRAIRNSSCTQDGSSWTGTIDNALERLLRRVARFFEDEASARMPNKEKARTFIRQTDPLGWTLPPSVENSRVSVWDQCKGYFSAVSHHDPRMDASDVPAYMTLVEDFLLDHLRPSTTSDQATILSIIVEAEQDD